MKIPITVSSSVSVRENNKISHLKVHCSLMWSDEFRLWNIRQHRILCRFHNAVMIAIQKYLHCNQLSNLHLPLLDRTGSTLKPLMRRTDFSSSRPCKNSIYNSRQHLTIFICFRLLPCCSRNNSAGRISCLYFFTEKIGAGFTIQLNNIRNFDVYC
jgi:hypothetical protein